MRPMLLDSICVPNVPQFTITTTASDVVPLSLILPLKPKKKAPNTMMQKHFLYFFKFCNSPPGGPNRLFNSFPMKRQAKTDRASDQAIDRPSDRSTERFSHFFFQNVFSSGTAFSPPLSTFSPPLSTALSHAVERASERAIEQVISCRPIPIDGLVGYREANRISRRGVLFSRSAF